MIAETENAPVTPLFAAMAAEINYQAAQIGQASVRQAAGARLLACNGHIPVLPSSGDFRWPGSSFDHLPSGEIPPGRSGVLGFSGGVAFLGSLEDGAGGDDVWFGWLEDGVAVAAGEVSPGGTEVEGVVVFGVFRGAAQAVDFFLGLACVLADPVDLLGYWFMDCGRGEAECLLAAG